MHKLSFKSLFLIIIFLLIPIVFLLRLGQKRNIVMADWWNDSWTYRQRVDIAGVGSTKLTDFQVSFSVGTSALINAGKMKSDCSDIRITDQTGDVLPYWIEENNPGCNATATKIWVKVNSLPTSGAPIYLYYGNPTATAVQNAKNVFEFFDDFNLSYINPNVWTATGTYTISGGTLTIATGAIYTKNPVVSSANNYIYEYKSKWNTTTGSYSGLQIANANNVQSSNAGSNQLAMFMSNSGSTLSITGWAANGTAASYNIVSGNAQYNAAQNVYVVDSISIGSSISFYNNHSLTGSYFGTWSGAPYLWLGYFMGSASGVTDIKDITTDWVLVRKYASAADPTATAATEEVGGGPIAYWKFDEGVGTSTFDSTTNGNNGVLGTGTSSPTWADESQCVTGKCLFFDGSNDKVTIPNSNSLNFSTGPFTATMWIKTNFTSLGGIIDKGAGAFGNNNGWAISYASNPQTMYLIIGNGSTNKQYNTSIATQTTWKQIGIIRDSSNKIYYVNDGNITYVGSTLAGDVGNTSPLTIGFNQSFNTSVKGYIDDVKIFPYARTAAQIKQDYNLGAANIGGPQNNKSLSDGLVGYWKFDEGVGTSLLDSSNNNHTFTFGTGSSSPIWSTGKYGIGLSFNGGQYATINNNFQITNPFSISVWINMTSGGTNQQIIGNQYGGRILIGIPATGQICLESNVTVNTCFTTGIALNDGRWHHIVEVGDSQNKGTLYLDQNIVGTLTIAPPQNGTTWFGGNNYGGALFMYTGLLDEVRIYNRALNATEVKALYNYAPGPVAYWKFDEGVGTTAYDSSGNGYNGGWIGTLGNQWSTGKIGKAGNFNGIDNYLNIGTAINSKINNTVTIGMWIKPNTLSSGSRYGLIGTNYWTNNEFSFQIHDSPNRYCIVYGDALISCDPTVVTSNDWSYISLVYDGTKASNNFSIYINGILKSSGGTYQSPLASNAIAALKIGFVQQYFNGLIDEVKIYNYARTAEQIIQDMGSIGSAPNTAKLAGPIAWYKFDEGYGSVTNNSGVGGTINGTLSNASWSNVGKINKALSFNGSNSYVDIGTSLGNYTDNFSVSAWVKTGTQNTRILGRREASTQYDMYVQNNTGKIGFYAGASEFAGTTNVADNQWHFLSWIINGANSKLYVDGKTEATFTPVITARDITTIIGAYNKNGPSGVMNGLIDEVKIYNYALSSDEIKQDYNAGAAIVFGSSNQTIGATTTSLDYCIPGDTTYCANPVAEYKFEEGTGTTAFDSSGNNNGTISNGSWATGKIGKAISFNGSNTNIDSGTSPTLLPDIWTIEAWVKPNNTASSALISWDTTTNPPYIALQHSTTGQPLIYMGPNNYRYFPATAWTKLIDGNWHHVAFTMTGVGQSDIANSQMFIDGINQIAGSAYNVGPQNSKIKFKIGSGGGYFSGKMDQVRVYNYVRSSSQISYDYNKGGPIGWWKFDECQGNISNDSSGIGNTGSITIGSGGTQNSLGTCTVGTSAAWTSGATGKINSSLNFDGTDDVVMLANEPFFDFEKTQGFTISTWTKTTTNSLTQGIFTKLDPNSPFSGWGLVVGGSDHYYYLNLVNNNSSNEIKVRSTNSVPLNTWVHLVATYDGSSTASGAKIYINGINQTTIVSDNLTSTILNNITPSIGSYGGVNRYFSGQIDDVQIYNYALTATQVKTLYNGGAVNFR